MIGTAAKAHDVTAQSDDARHNTDIDGLADQARPLLDVRFEVGAMTLRVEAGQWPLAQFTSSGELTGSTNPFMDYHLIYALVLIVLAVLGAGRYFGIAPWWARVTGGQAWLR